MTEVLRASVSAPCFGSACTNAFSIAGELHRIARGAADDVSGTVTVTALDVLVPFALPMLARVQAEHPALTVDLVSSDRVLKLEYGEAALAFRIGRKPDHPDNVVIKAGTIEIGLYATSAYVEAFDLPNSPDDYAAHRFVGPGDETPRTPYFEWLKETVPLEAITFRSNNVASSFEAVKAGLGIGFLPQQVAEALDCLAICDPECQGSQRRSASITSSRTTMQVMTGLTRAGWSRSGLK